MLHPRFSARALALVLLLSFATGCAAIRRAPMQVPAGIQAPADPAARVETYKKLFPELAVLKTQDSNLVASKGRLTGNENLRFFLLAVDRNNMRLNVSKDVNVHLFDVLIKDGVMSVVFYKSGDKFPGAIFQGDVAGGSTPFGRRFGFEPWDLIPMFKIGQSIASGSFEAAGSEKDPELVPADSSDPANPKKIELDPASGLPSRAVWKRPVARHWWSLRRNARLRVTYQEWKLFKDDRMPEEPARLMPAKIRMTSNAPKAVLDIDIQNGYRFTPTVPPAVFNINVSYNYYPLEKLDEFLKQ